MTDRANGATVGHYRLDGLLGRGGMGEVHRAYDLRRERVVALKLLSPALADDEQFRERFRRESHVVARMSSPHVVPIHDFGEIDGRLFLDMRLIDGVGLDRLIADGPLAVPRAASIAGQIAAALRDAHGHGVVHRDIKPSNVLVTPDGFAYLVDFGIARSSDDTALTETGAAVGTLAYMAPERFEGGPPDARSDLYALACVLAECLMGRRPFAGDSLPTLMRAHLDAPPPRPSEVVPGVPPALDDVIARGMSKDPRDRFPDAAAFADAVEWAARRSPASGTKLLDHPAPAPAQPRRSRSLLLAAGALGIAVIAGGTGAVLGVGLTSGSGGPGPTAAPAATSPATPVPAASTLPKPLPPIASRPQTASRPTSYTFTVESNYPVMLIYTDSKGDQVNRQSVPAPWSEVIATATGRRCPSDAHCGQLFDEG